MEASTVRAARSLMRSNPVTALGLMRWLGEVQETAAHVVYGLRAALASFFVAVIKQPPLNLALDHILLRQRQGDNFNADPLAKRLRIPDVSLAPQLLPIPIFRRA